MRIIFFLFFNWFYLHPSKSSENDNWNYSRNDHEENTKGVSSAPFKFWHSCKVHSVNTSDKCWWKKNDRNDRENLDDVILFNVDQSECGIK